MSPVQENHRNRHLQRDRHVRIEWCDSDPLIWRQVKVPTSITLKALHDVIQMVMGWLDCHLWEFTQRPANTAADGRRGADRGTRSRQGPPARRADAADEPSSTTSMTSAIAGNTGSPLRTSGPVNLTSPIHVYRRRTERAAGGLRRHPGFFYRIDARRPRRSTPSDHSASRNGWMTTTQRHRPVADQVCPEPHCQSAKRRQGTPRPEQEKQNQFVIRRET